MVKLTILLALCAVLTGCAIDTPRCEANPNDEACLGMCTVKPDSSDSARQLWFFEHTDAPPPNEDLCGEVHPGIYVCSKSACSEVRYAGTCPICEDIRAATAKAEPTP